MKTTKKLWDKESVGINVLALDRLPQSHGIRVNCSEGCENKITEEMKTCRDCRRKLKRIELKKRLQLGKTNF